VRWAELGLKTSEGWGYQPIFARLILAMAHARLNDPKRSRSELEAAQRALENYPEPASGKLDDSWHDTLTCWILRAEAEEIVDQLTVDVTAKEPENSSMNDGM
jgi:hypothetical protein